MLFVVTFFCICSLVNEVLEENIRAQQAGGHRGPVFHHLLGFLPHPQIPRLLPVGICLLLFTQKCDIAILWCLFNPFQLLMPLKSQEDLDKAMEQLELSPSLKSLRILVSAPKKANVSPSPSLLLCVQPEMPCYCAGEWKGVS